MRGISREVLARDAAWTLADGTCKDLTKRWAAWENGYLAAQTIADLATKVKPRGTGVEVDLVGTDATGRRWAFLISGGFTATRTGLRRADTLWRALGQAAVLQVATDLPVVLLTTDLPARSTPGHQALRQALGADGPVTAAVDLTAADAPHALAALTRSPLAPPPAD